MTMLHILNTLEREYSKDFVGFLNQGIENIEESYSMQILDVYEQELDFYDNRNNKGFEEHNLKFEDRVFRFFEDVFKLNNNSVIIGNFNINNVENMKILYMLRDLDYKDSIKLINILRSHVREDDVYKVTDFGILKMLLTLCTREIHFPSFYFDKSEILVFTHYDLSFPMFFKDKKNIGTYEELAKINKLYLRKNEIDNKPLVEV